MKNCVLVAAIGGMEMLGEIVSFFKAGEIDEQAA